MAISAYESLAKERGDLTLIGCWAHARRGFHEALAETKLAAWFVRQIGLLYAVEKKLREQKAGPATAAAMRAWQSRNRYWHGCTGRWSWCGEKPCRKGLLGQAIDYALKRWEALTRFVDGRDFGDRQQPDRECDSAQCTRKKELVVRRASRSWGTQRGDLHVAGQLPAARDQPIRLSEGFVHPFARSQDHRNQIVHASGLDQSYGQTESGCSCRLKLLVSRYP